MPDGTALEKSYYFFPMAWQSKNATGVNYIYTLNILKGSLKMGGGGGVFLDESIN